MSTGVKQSTKKLLEWRHSSQLHNNPYKIIKIDGLKEDLNNVQTAKPP